MSKLITWTITKRDFCNKKVRKKVANVWDNGRDLPWRIKRCANNRLNDNLGSAFKNHKLVTKIYWCGHGKEGSFNFAPNRGLRRFLCCTNWDIHTIRITVNNSDDCCIWSNGSVKIEFDPTCLWWVPLRGSGGEYGQPCFRMGFEGSVDVNNKPIRRVGQVFKNQFVFAPPDWVTRYCS